MFYLVRHGEPDYSEAETKVYRGFGSHMCPLTEKGRSQIKNTAKDPRLQDVDLIISSPYGRALHTAAILAKELNVDLVVETDLHEWLANKNYVHENLEIAAKNHREFMENNGISPEGFDKDWESFEVMRNRATRVLVKYKNYDKVIVVCHGMLIQSLTCLHHPNHGEIFEFQI